MVEVMYYSLRAAISFQQEKKKLAVVQLKLVIVKVRFIAKQIKQEYLISYCKMLNSRKRTWKQYQDGKIKISPQAAAFPTKYRIFEIDYKDYDEWMGYFDAYQTYSECNIVIRTPLDWYETRKETLTNKRFRAYLSRLDSHFMSQNCMI